MIGLIEQKGPWSFLDELESLQTDFNRLFDGGSRSRRGGRFPLMNVWQAESGLVLEAELPGVDPKDLDISIRDGRLTLSGKRSAPGGEGEGYCMQERIAGAFSRSVSLPFRVDANRVKANIRNGVLHVELPRAEEDKARRIEVQAA